MKSLAIQPFALRIALLGLLLAPGGVARGERADDHPELDELSFEELLQVPVVTASRTEERLGDASATVIVLDAETLRRRGYLDLGEILDDLPGMDVVRPWGATYLKNYWRGYRNTIGDPYLLLLDGREMNHLYFNTTDLLTALPLSSVDRVEVVYGPASSVYGPNAFMGVINVITRPRPRSGRGLWGFATVGSDATRIVDLAADWRGDDWSVRFAGRADRGELGASAAFSEYHRDRYYSEPGLWGEFLAPDGPATGRPSSTRDHRAFDLRISRGEWELGAAWIRLEAGYGREYAGDRAQSDAVWREPELSLHLRHEHRWENGLRTVSLLRYRESGIDDASFWVESQPGDPQRVQFSYWGAENSSWSLLQRFEGRGGERTFLWAGLEVERKSLQKAYDISYGPAVPAAELDLDSYPFPPHSPTDPIPGNRIHTWESGLYGQARYRLGEGHFLVLGGRVDHHSEYSTATSLRGGWLLRRGRWGWKLLYGQGFQEPNPRVLYGGWTGSGSDPDLDPERSATVELAASLTLARLSAHLSLYHAQNQDTIVNTADGARNLGDREMTGLDLHLRGVLAPALLDRLELWSFASWLLSTDERGAGAAALPSGDVPDLAKLKLLFGLTATAREHWTFTARGRWIGARETVGTNPVREVPSYLGVDLFLRRDAVFHPRLGLSLRVTNALDEPILHPGVREADAGSTPGFFDDEGRWIGSQGFFASVLPQPGRSLQLTLHWEG